jgi:FkbM family methyltransferase
MQKLIFKLISSPAIRKTVLALRLHLLGNWWVRCFPFIKTLPGTGIRYRARRLESIGLSVEIFKEGIYTMSALPTDIRTFADLGCNVGYFTCWLHHELGRPRLKGLMVDANADAIEDARWHVQANGFLDVQVLCGLVGTPAEAEASFYLHRSNICSAAVLPGDTSDSDAAWTRVKVAGVNIAETWHKHFGNEPCDLLKVDIEGSEMDFFRNEAAFLDTVQTILIEWHKWRVSLNEIEQFLSSRSFFLKAILHEDAERGTAVFSRKTSLR